MLYDYLVTVYFTIDYWTMNIGSKAAYLTFKTIIVLGFLQVLWSQLTMIDYFTIQTTINKNRSKLLCYFAYPVISKSCTIGACAEYFFTQLIFFFALRLRITYTLFSHLLSKLQKPTLSTFIIAPYSWKHQTVEFPARVNQSSYPLPYTLIVILS